MKKKKWNGKKIISNIFEMPKEIVYDLPLITLIGREEISIENYKGIVEYTESRIRVKTGSGVFKIEGSRLFLKHISAENILVIGFINKLEYLS